MWADLTLTEGIESALPAERAAFVQLRGVERRYPNGTVALADVDLTIERAESIAIIGRSGSGKSTLLNVLGLLDAPDVGDLTIDGRSVATANDRVRAELRSAELGFVFQRSHLIPALTVRENVLLGLRYSRVPESMAVEVAEKALQEVGLGPKAGVRARTLSGGEMQRVAIARTLARPARLWLADEPTGNLDSSQSVEIIDLLKLRAAERGAALVVVTHEPEIAARMDRVITLRDGRIVGDTGRPLPPTALKESRPSTAHDSTTKKAKVTVRRRLTRSARFIAQGIAANPGRTRSGVLASALAVALTVAALGLAQSAAAQVTSLFDAQRATQVTADLASDTASPRWPVRIETVRGYTGVTGAEYWMKRIGIAMQNGSVSSQDVEVIEVDAAPGTATDSAVTWAAGDNNMLDEGEVILGETLAQRLGVTQIDRNAEVTLEGTRLRVVGVLTSSRSGTATGSAFVTASSTAGLPPSLSGELFVETVPGAARNVADRLQSLADPYQARRMTIAPVLAADTYRGQLQESVAVSLQVLAVVASLAGLGGVVFVNILSISTRTAEFGVRRAFGASQGEVVFLVIGECSVLGALGAVLGLSAGFVSVMVVTAMAHWQPVFDPYLLLVPLVGALVFGALGGLPPAIAASRIQPADAVRS